MIDYKIRYDEEFNAYYISNEPGVFLSISEVKSVLNTQESKIAELEESNKTLMQRATDLERELWLINS